MNRPCDKDKKVHRGCQEGRENKGLEIYEHTGMIFSDEGHHVMGRDNHPFGGEF